jgi:hypothetical protein
LLACGDGWVLGIHSVLHVSAVSFYNGNSALSFELRSDYTPYNGFECAWHRLGSMEGHKYWFEDAKQPGWYKEIDTGLELAKFSAIRWCGCMEHARVTHHM